MMADKEYEQEHTIRLRNALRYISRSNEDLFYSDTDAIRIHDSFDVNDPFADVIDELDGSKCRKSENNDAGAYQEKVITIFVYFSIFCYSKKNECLFCVQRASRSDDALGLMAKFTAEHHEALLKTRTTMKVDSNLNFCAEDLNTLKVNPPENTIDKELLIEINAQLDSCSLESHRKPVNVHIKNPVPAVNNIYNLIVEYIFLMFCLFLFHRRKKKNLSKFGEIVVMHQSILYH